MLMAAIVPPSSPIPKGKAPLRARPDDFEVIFVEQGRERCESWYRARKTTINRWLEECGKVELINRRAAFVASQRAAGKWLTRQTCMVEVRVITSQAPRSQPIRDRRKVSPTIARHAAQFLRVARNGGWIVSPSTNGEWFVGCRRLSSAQLVDLARSKGFKAVEVRE